MITEEDSFDGLLLSEVAYGYAVMAILFQLQNSDNSTLLPSDDLLVHIGDRLIILANIEGLKRIEKGNRQPQTSELIIQLVNSKDALFEGTNIIDRITGCDLPIARETMNSLPKMLPIKLYYHQAMRLIKV